MQISKKYPSILLTSFLMFNSQRTFAISYSKQSKVLIGISGALGSYVGYKLSHFIFNKENNYGFRLIVLTALLSGGIAAIIAEINTPEGSFCDAQRKIKAVSEDLLNFIKETDNAQEFCDKVKSKNVNCIFPLNVEFELYQKLYNDLLGAKTTLLKSKELKDQAFNGLVQEAMLLLPKIEEYLSTLAQGMQMLKTDSEWLSMINAKNLEESRIAQ